MFTSTDELIQEVTVTIVWTANTVYRIYVCIVTTMFMSESDVIVVCQSSSLLNKLEEFCGKHGVNIVGLKTVVKSLFSVLKSKVLFASFIS